MVKTFKHGGGGGDMIYGLATMRALGGGILFLNIDAERKFYKRLLEAQPYITKLMYYSLDSKEWKMFKVDYDLDLFRYQPFNNGYTILECHAMAMKKRFNLENPWLFNIEPLHVADIVINDTGKLRWEGVTVDWEELRGYEKKAVFVGLDVEHNNFCKNRNYEVSHYKIKDAMHFAQVIAGSKLYLGNQSTGLAIAEGLKHPRVADLYLGKSKQYPKGKTGHWELKKELIERYLNG
jgi:hypothetical protein